jgi:hypothetical protein
MAKINQGILGGFAGKVGNVIGGTWKGINYMRVKPSSVANPKTEGQVSQRTKFSTVLQFLQPIKDHIKVGYKNYATKQTEFNSAMSYILNNAVIGEGSDFSIDYSSVLVSRGSLSMALNPVAGSDLSGGLHVSWSDNSTEVNANSTDAAFILVYASNLGQAVSLKAEATRADKSYDITLPDNFKGEKVDVFISFLSSTGKDVSNSKYIGSVAVTA